MTPEQARIEIGIEPDDDIQTVITRLVERIILLESEVTGLISILACSTALKEHAA